MATFFFLIIANFGQIKKALLVMPLLLSSAFNQMCLNHHTIQVVFPIVMLPPVKSVCYFQECEEFDAKSFLLF